MRLRRGAVTERPVVRVAESVPDKPLTVCEKVRNAVFWALCDMDCPDKHL